MELVATHTDDELPPTRLQNVRTFGVAVGDGLGDLHDAAVGWSEDIALSVPAGFDGAELSLDVLPGLVLVRGGVDRKTRLGASCAWQTTTTPGSGDSGPAVEVEFEVEVAEVFLLSTLVAPDLEAQTRSTAKRDAGFDTVSVAEELSDRHALLVTTAGVLAEIAVAIAGNPAAHAVGSEHHEFSEESESGTMRH